MNLCPTKWIPILGYEGFYEIHPDGFVRSLDRTTTGKHGHQRVSGKHISPIRHAVHGYYVVNLVKNGKRKQHRLHVLVANHFIPNVDGKKTVNHITGDKSKNAAYDLEWATHQEQMNHAAENNLTAKGERNAGNKLSNSQVIKAFNDCMSGEEVTVIAQNLGVNRNTITKAFYRLGFKDQWQAEAKRRKSKASKKRWNSA